MAASFEQSDESEEICQFLGVIDPRIEQVLAKVSSVSRKDILDELMFNFDKDVLIETREIVCYAAKQRLIHCVDHIIRSRNTLSAYKDLDPYVHEEWPQIAHMRKNPWCLINRRSSKLLSNDIVELYMFATGHRCDFPGKIVKTPAIVTVEEVMSKTGLIRIRQPMREIEETPEDSNESGCVSMNLGQNTIESEGGLGLLMEDNGRDLVTDDEQENSESGESDEYDSESEPEPQGSDGMTMSLSNNIGLNPMACSFNPNSQDIPDSGQEIPIDMSIPKHESPEIVWITDDDYPMGCSDQEAPMNLSTNRNTGWSHILCCRCMNEISAQPIAHARSTDIESSIESEMEKRGRYSKKEKTDARTEAEYAQIADMVRRLAQLETWREGVEMAFIGLEDKCMDVIGKVSNEHLDIMDEMRNVISTVKTLEEAVFDTSRAPTRPIDRDDIESTPDIEKEEIETRRLKDARREGAVSRAPNPPKRVDPNQIMQRNGGKSDNCDDGGSRRPRAREERPPTVTERPPNRESKPPNTASERGKSGGDKTVNPMQEWLASANLNKKQDMNNATKTNVDDTMVLKSPSWADDIGSDDDEESHDDSPIPCGQRQTQTKVKMAEPQNNKQKQNMPRANRSNGARGKLSNIGASLNRDQSDAVHEHDDGEDSSAQVDITTPHPSYADMMNKPGPWNKEYKKRKRNKSSPESIPFLKGVNQSENFDVFIRGLDMNVCPDPRDMAKVVKAHCIRGGVYPVYVKVFPADFDYSKSGARVTVREVDAVKVLNDEFWPNHIKVRKWEERPRAGKGKKPYEGNEY